MIRAALCRLAPSVGRRAPGCLACHTSSAPKGVGVIGATFDKGQVRMGVVVVTVLCVTIGVKN